MSQHLLALVVAVSLLTVATPITGSCQHVPQSQAARRKDLGEIALRYLREQGIEERQLEHLVPERDGDNTHWNNYVASNSPLSWDFNPELGARLEGARYWAVYLAPTDEEQVGGDYWVFISKDDLHVIGWFGGQ
jgi:hypothetical protein